MARDAVVVAEVDSQVEGKWADAAVVAVAVVLHHGCCPVAVHDSYGNGGFLAGCGMA